jgi:hypothetical protein
MHPFRKIKSTGSAHYEDAQKRAAEQGGGNGREVVGRLSATTESRARRINAKIGPAAMPSLDRSGHGL